MHRICRVFREHCPQDLFGTPSGTVSHDATWLNSICIQRELFRVEPQNVTKCILSYEMINCTECAFHMCITPCY
ncbi:hypothetical protein T03_5001 [Trichinella britovi]|uniref:Uncharacterized protein n=1 Tax=Trichinella britovi TaxID=45882 RepID=A0A0V1D8S9_TRIBR|nr:hypothetical protein T03_5001 [Trichinella britovi]